MQAIQNTISESQAVIFSKPVIAPFLIPVTHDSTPNCINSPFMVDGKCYGVTALSFGSPYGVVVVDNLDDTDVSALGAALGTHRLFPKGANIVFMQMLGRENLKAQAWPMAGEKVMPFEAACAAGTAAMMLRKVLSGTVTVRMGENSFQVAWDKGEGDVRLTESRAEMGDDYY